MLPFSLITYVEQALALAQCILRALYGGGRGVAHDDAEAKWFRLAANLIPFGRAGVGQDGWRGVKAKEQVVKEALYGVLQDHNEEDHFRILLQQREY